jgi:hypothetical protein|tara:strand:+ start:2336 stop:2446 length:111 start_codon:yes stop_codon:yes gene_type:complete
MAKIIDMLSEEEKARVLEVLKAVKEEKKKDKEKDAK